MLSAFLLLAACDRGGFMVVPARPDRPPVSGGGGSAGDTGSWEPGCTRVEIRPEDSAIPQADAEAALAAVGSRAVRWATDDQATTLAQTFEVAGEVVAVHFDADEEGGVCAPDRLEIPVRWALSTSDQRFGWSVDATAFAEADGVRVAADGVPSEFPYLETIADIARGFTAETAVSGGILSTVLAADLTTDDTDGVQVLLSLDEAL